MSRPASAWRRPAGSSSGCAPRSSRRAPRASGPSRGSTVLGQRRLLAASTDRRDEADGRPRPGRAPKLRRGPGRPLHQRRGRRPAPTRRLLLDYVAANGSTWSRSPSSSRARPRCAAPGRRAVGGETAECPGSTAQRAGLRGHLRRDRRRATRSTAPASSRATSSSASPRPACTRTVSLVRHVLQTEDYDSLTCSAPRGLPRRCRALRDRARGFAHVTGGGIKGNLARAPTACACGSTGLVAAAARVRVARPARRRGRAAARLQPRASATAPSSQIRRG